MSYIDVEYYIETIKHPEEIAEKMAGIQSIGIQKNINKKVRKKLEKYSAIIKKIKLTGYKNKYELPTRVKNGKRVNCASVILSFPVRNFGGNIAQFLTTVAGEIFDLKELTALKVLDIKFTLDFIKFFKGPKFGLEGTRDIINAKRRPLFGAIIKPCVGLTAKEIAELAFNVALAGADFIKDDELLGDVSYNTIKQRAKAVSSGLKKAYEKTGKITMYAFNITDYPDKIFLLHDTVKKYGGKAIMYNVLAGGFPLLKKLAEYTELPIHCHRDFSVAILRSEYIGLTSNLFTKLVRICGGDMIQCGGIESSLYEKDEEVLKNFSACTEKLWHIKKALPVSSGGEWAGKLPVNLRKIKNSDFLFLCGSGIFDHPDGPFAGMKSIISAYRAIKKGIKLENFDCNALKKAIEYFGEVIY
ncbi:MAG: RuBisCO large subunit C-terminal-like domain-containing protein [Candidatus Goldbacteria bacterium]|nr:RuBisCO large subunit C-terminal-like domain-containing protein [Candidatus Goldiibacteriota bacterium]